jgi:hypothetical protein
LDGRREQNEKTEVQKIEGGLAHDTKVDRVNNLGKDVMLLGSDL